MFWRRGQPLYRTYEDERVSLSNSYALLSTLVAPSNSMVERRSAMDDNGEPPSTSRARSLVSDRQEQPRQLGSPGSKRALRWHVREPYRGGEVRDVRERESA